MIRPIALLGLALLAGCGHVDQTARMNIGGRTVMVDSTLNQDLQGKRVVDQFGVVATPAFTYWSPEIEEHMIAGGEQEARKLCGGEVELVRISQAPIPARTGRMRFRCL